MVAYQNRFLGHKQRKKNLRRCGLTHLIDYDHIKRIKSFLTECKGVFRARYTYDIACVDVRIQIYFVLQRKIAVEFVDIIDKFVEELFEVSSVLGNRIFNPGFLSSHSPLYGSFSYFALVRVCKSIELFFCLFQLVVKACDKFSLLFFLYAERGKTVFIFLNVLTKALDFFLKETF